MYARSRRNTYVDAYTFTDGSMLGKSKKVEYPPSSLGILPNASQHQGASPYQIHIPSRDRLLKWWKGDSCIWERVPWHARWQTELVKFHMDPWNAVHPKCCMSFPQQNRSLWEWAMGNQWETMSCHMINVYKLLSINVSILPPQSTTRPEWRAWCTTGVSVL